MNVELLSNRLLSALFNGGYQGLLLTMLIWVGLKLFPRANAATRHAVWFTTLLVVAAMPVIHFLMPQPISKMESGEPGSVAVEAGSSSTSPAGPASFEPARSDQVFDQLTSLQAPAFSGELSPDSSQQFFASETLNQSAGADVPLNDVRSVTPSSPETDSGLAADAHALARLPLIPQGWRLEMPKRAGVVVVGLWFTLAAIRLGSLARQFFQLHSLKRRASTAPDRLREVFSALSEEMGLKRKTRLLLCEERTVPMAVGFRRPAVLLPAEVLAGAAEVQVQQVLRHELAHVVRGDDWANLAQQVIAAVLFFHPAVRWISKRLTLEREVACDDHVLAATRTPHVYALLLTEFASRMHGRALLAAPAAWSHKNQLKERIAMILDSKRNASPRLTGVSVGVLTTATALIAGLALFAGPRLALAGETPVAEPSVELTLEEQPVVEPAVEIAPPSVATVISLGGADGLTIHAPPEPPSFAPPRLNAHVSLSSSSGPRPKPSPRLEGEGPVAVNALPTPPTLSVAALPAVAVSVHSQPAPAAMPVHVAHSGRSIIVASAEPAPPKPAKVSGKRNSDGDDDEALERRVERLERLIEELRGREKGKRAEGSPDFQLRFHDEVNKEMVEKLAEHNAKQAAKSAKAGLDENEIERIKEHARREAERATRDVEKVVKEARRSAEAGRNGEKIRTQVHAEVKELEGQRKALEAQQKSLEKQMEALERQIEKLEEAQEKIEQRAEREVEERRSNSVTIESSADGETGPKKKTGN